MSKKNRLHIFLLPALFFAALLAKMLYFTAHNWSLAPVAAQPGFYLLKMAAALAFCALAFFFRSKIWTIVFSFFFDFWIVANQVYLRSNYLCFDGYSVTLAKNLDGYASGILGLFDWSDIVYVAITVVYAVCVILFGRRRSIADWRAGVASGVLAVLLNFVGMLCINRGLEGGDRCLNPFSSKMHDIYLHINDYACNISVAHLFIYDVADVVRLWTGTSADVDLSFSEDEEAVLNQIYIPENEHLNKAYTDTVVILLIESMENWAVHPDIMPNTAEFVSGEHVLYADKVRIQIMAGTSSDGQFIINTGLLPIDRGALAFTFPEQRYPSIASCAAGEAVTLIPHPDAVWNQKQMSPAEGYSRTVQIDEPDDVVFGSALEAVRGGAQVVQTLTVSSHVPFNYGSHRSALKTPLLMPVLLSSYIKCMNYTDENLEMIYRETREGGLLHNATVVITGDHTIFYKDKRHLYQGYCREAGLDYRVDEPYCPLIIYSPAIERNTRIEEECWQMDIYPTVMGLLGNPDKSWKGLGRDLSDSASAGRFENIEDARRLGNKIVRRDIFSQK